MGPLLIAVSVFLAQAPAASVSFDLRPLSDADYRKLDGLGMERRVALRLIQEGFAVVSPDSPAAQLRLRMVRVPEGLMLEAAGPLDRIEQLVRLDERSLAELHLEVAQAAAELSRRLKREPPTPVPSPPPVISALPEPATDARGWTLGVALGTSWRGAEVDPHLLVAAGRLAGDWAFEGELGLASSREGDLSVLELQSAAFVSRRISILSPRFRLEPGIGAGAILHGYQLADRWASAQSGTQASPAAWARLEAGWRFSERVELGVRLALGAARPLVHQSEGVVWWSRPGWRAETGAQLSWSP